MVCISCETHQLGNGVNQKECLHPDFSRTTQTRNLIINQDYLMLVDVSLTRRRSCTKISIRFSSKYLSIINIHPAGFDFKPFLSKYNIHVHFFHCCLINPQVHCQSERIHHHVFDVKSYGYPTVLSFFTHRPDFLNITMIFALLAAVAYIHCTWA